MLTASPEHLLMTKWPRASTIIQHMRSRQRSRCITNDKRCLCTSPARYPITTLEYFGNIENAFINALVQAGSCRRSNQQWPRHSLMVPAYKRYTWVQPVLSYNRLPFLVQDAVESIGSPFSKPRMRGLVDYYEDYGRSGQSGQMQIEIEDEPNTVDPPHEELEEKRMHLLEKMSEADRRNLDAFRKQILLLESLRNMANDERQVRDLETNFAELWRRYKALSNSPKGRILCLNRFTRGSLLQIFAVSARQNPATARRYLSFLDDMKSSGLYISRRRWNTAIHIVGRSLGEVRADDIESALRIWMSVDGEKGIEGDTCTFNILLDVAAKGGEFPLAEMILDEMRERKLKFDKYTRVGLIYYHGVRRDGNAIRKAYWEYAEEEVLVETAALNAVIAALFRAGEPQAAEHVYQRMKEMAEDSKMHPGSFPSDAIAVAQQVLLAKTLHDTEQIRQIREQQRISPDAQTYSILVKHHVDFTGDLEKIANLLSDMQYLEVPSHGRVFCELFRGFYQRGGSSFTLWTSSALDRVWTALVYAIDRGGGVYWDKWMAIWVLRAYSVCAGRNTALQKWEIIKRNWRRASDYEGFMLSVITYAQARAEKRGQKPRPTTDSVDVEIDDSAQIESGFRL